MIGWEGYPKGKFKPKKVDIKAVESLGVLEAQEVAHIPVQNIAQNSVQMYEQVEETFSTHTQQEIVKDVPKVPIREESEAVAEMIVAAKSLEDAATAVHALVVASKRLVITLEKTLNKRRK